MNTRFWVNVDKSGDCWLWTGTMQSRGYGYHERTTAHRWVYLHEVGLIPKGMVVDHLCHNDTECAGGPTCLHRRCVNPAHLGLKTIGANVAASHLANGRKTHCPRGHEYTPENTRVQTMPDGGERRSCRTCAKENDWSPKRADQQRRRRAAKRKAGRP